MHLNLLTDSDGEAAGFRALELPVDFHAVHFQDKAIRISVKRCIFFVVVFINNGVIFFATSTKKECGGHSDERQCNKSDRNVAAEKFRKHRILQIAFKK